VKNIPKSFTHKMAAKASWHWNYVTVTLSIIVLQTALDYITAINCSGRASELGGIVNLVDPTTVQFITLGTSTFLEIR